MNNDIFCLKIVNKQTLFIQDIAGRRKRATMDDFDNITRLCENSRNVKLVGVIPVDPVDIPDQNKPAILVHHLMRYSNKPLMGQAVIYEGANQIFELIELVMGQTGFLDDHVAIAYGVNPASPIRFDKPAGNQELDGVRICEPWWFDSLYLVFALKIKGPGVMHPALSVFEA